MIQIPMPLQTLKNRITFVTTRTLETLLLLHDEHATRTTAKWLMKGKRNKVCLIDNSLKNNERSIMHKLYTNRFTVHYTNKQGTERYNLGSTTWNSRTAKRKKSINGQMEISTRKLHSLHTKLRTSWNGATRISRPVGNSLINIHKSSHSLVPIFHEK